MMLTLRDGGLENMAWSRREVIVVVDVFGWLKISLSRSASRRISGGGDILTE